MRKNLCARKSKRGLRRGCCLTASGGGRLGRTEIQHYGILLLGPRQQHPPLIPPSSLSLLSLFILIMLLCRPGRHRFGLVTKVEAGQVAVLAPRPVHTQPPHAGGQYRTGASRERPASHAPSMQLLPTMPMTDMRGIWEKRLKMESHSMQS